MFFEKDGYVVVVGKNGEAYLYDQYGQKLHKAVLNIVNQETISILIENFVHGQR